jgi:predicted DNA-binding protein YlxM (UPF0122 family)
VIICDIEKSRKIDDWNGIINLLNESLKEINMKFKESIISEFRPTIGDEFQGILNNPENAYDIYIFFKNELSVNFYFGIGVGNAEIPPTAAEGHYMRGSAFYRARDALEACKNKKRHIFIKSSNTQEHIDDVINAMFQIIGILEKSMTDKQRKIVNYYRKNQDFTYKQIGQKFGTTKQTVYDILKAANWNIISICESQVRRLLEYLSSETYCLTEHE